MSVDGADGVWGAFIIPLVNALAPAPTRGALVTRAVRARHRCRTPTPSALRARRACAHECSLRMRAGCSRGTWFTSIETAVPFMPSAATSGSTSRAAVVGRLYTPATRPRLRATLGAEGERWAASLRAMCSPGVFPDLRSRSPALQVLQTDRPMSAKSKSRIRLKRRTRSYDSRHRHHTAMMS